MDLIISWIYCVVFTLFYGHSYGITEFNGECTCILVVYQTVSPGQLSNLIGDALQVYSFNRFNFG